MYYILAKITMVPRCSSALSSSFVSRVVRISFFRFAPRKHFSDVTATAFTTRPSPPLPLPEPDDPQLTLTWEGNLPPHADLCMLC